MKFKQINVSIYEYQTWENSPSCAGSPAVMVSKRAVLNNKKYVQPKVWTWELVALICRSMCCRICKVLFASQTWWRQSNFRLFPRSGIHSGIAYTTIQIIASQTTDTCNIPIPHQALQNGYRKYFLRRFLQSTFPQMSTVKKISLAEHKTGPAIDNDRRNVGSSDKAKWNVKKKKKEMPLT